jgi:hypothetical protein
LNVRSIEVGENTFQKFWLNVMLRVLLLHSSCMCTSPGLVSAGNASSKMKIMLSATQLDPVLQKEYQVGSQEIGRQMIRSAMRETLRSNAVTRRVNCLVSLRRAIATGKSWACLALPVARCISLLVGHGLCYLFLYFGSILQPSANIKVGIGIRAISRVSISVIQSDLPICTSLGARR